MKLKALDLRESLKCNSELTGEIRADFVSKVYALLMWNIFPLSSGENRELLTDVQDLKQNQSDLKYEATMVRTSSDLHNLPEMNFIHLYDYSVVSTQKYHHIVLRGMHYRKLKSYQFFLEGNMKKLESKFCLPRYILACYLYIVSYEKLYNRACRTTWL